MASNKSSPRESQYQNAVIRRLRREFNGCYIFKNDTSYIQGIPDLTILFRDMWAALEVKTSADAPHQPNQDYYIQELNEMSFAAFIYPENEEDIFRELHFAFEPGR